MKYCEKCGNKLEEGFSFCDKCGAKTDNKKEEKKEEKKVEKKEEKVKEEKVEVKEHPPVPPMPPMPPKRGKGKIVFLTILNFLLLGAMITFLVLWLTKSTSCNTNSNSGGGGNDNPPVYDDNKYVGKWEQNVEYKSGSKVVERTYGLIELKKDGTFRSLFYDKDDISGTKEEIEGTYTVDGNEITFEFKVDGSKEKYTYSVKNDKLCLNDKCEDYLVKDSYNNKIVIQQDSNDDAIETINYTEYEDLQKNYEDAIVVVVKAGCSWCEKFEPVVEKINEEYETAVYYYMNDGKISISGTPTTIIIKNGYIVGTVEGYYNYDNMVEKLDELGVK